MQHVDLSRVPQYYHGYVSHVSADALTGALEKHPANLLPLLRSLAADKWDYRYAPEKWSIKEVVQHIIDAERIFAYRALCFARKDKTSLPGFDENAYALYSGAGNRTPAELMAELATVQQASLQLFGSFDQQQLDETGTANQKSIYVKGIAYVIMGHAMHHRMVLEERYLK